MRNDTVRRLAMAGVLAAAIILLTALVSVPLPGGHGYINLGDAGVMTAAYLLGGGWGFLCAGTASALSDLLLGWGVYAPATFMIKGLCALFAGLALDRFGVKKGGLALYPVSLLVPLGYFAYEAVLYGAATAILNLPLNLLQCLAGAGLAHGLIAVLDRHGGTAAASIHGRTEYARRVRNPKGGADVTLIAYEKEEGTVLRAADILSVQGYTACVLLIDPASKSRLSELIVEGVPHLRHIAEESAEAFAERARKEIRHDL